MWIFWRGCFQEKALQHSRNQVFGPILGNPTELYGPVRMRRSVCHCEGAISCIQGHALALE